MGYHRCFLLIVSLLVNISPPSVMGASINMYPVMPFIGKMYYIRCTLECDLVELENLQKTPFKFLFSYKVCEVKSWLKCDQRKTRLRDGDCYCSFRYIKDVKIFYEFFYFIFSFPSSVVKMTSCGLDYITTDKQEVEIVDFTETPGDNIMNCSGGELQLNWIFHPRSDNIRENLRPKQVRWSFQGQPLAEYELATKNLTTHVDHCCTMVKHGVFPILKLRKLSNYSDGVYNINVIFHQLTRPSEVIDVPEDGDSIRLKRDNEYYEEDAETAHGKGNKETEYEDPSDDLTTLPPLPETHNSLSGKTHVTVSLPPNRDIVLKIKGYTTVSGSIMVRCSVYNIHFFGRPEVNLTLWEMSRQVKSMSSVYSLVYSEAIGGRLAFNFSCGLTGGALLCLGHHDPRLKRVYLQDIVKEQTSDNRLDDIMRIAYGVQTVMCLGLICWVLSLLTQHVRVFIHREMIASQRNIREHSALMVHIVKGFPSEEDEDTSVISKTNSTVTSTDVRSPPKETSFVKAAGRLRRFVRELS